MAEGKRYLTIAEMKFRDGEVWASGSIVNVTYDPEHVMTCTISRNEVRKRVRIDTLYKYIRSYPRPPSTGTLQKWESAGICKTPSGHVVEPDGKGPDNSPSWLLVLGVI